MISLNWVGEYVDIKNENINELTDKITKFGVNIEQVISNKIDNLVIGEIIKTEKPGGPKTPSTPGNYIPGTGKTETDDSTAETVIVTPSTGANYNFIIPIAIGIGALVILGVGIYLIKRKTLNK